MLGQCLRRSGTQRPLSALGCDLGKALHGLACDRRCWLPASTFRVRICSSSCSRLRASSSWLCGRHLDHDRNPLWITRWQKPAARVSQHVEASLSLHAARNERIFGAKEDPEQMAQLLCLYQTHRDNPSTTAESCDAITHSVRHSALSAPDRALGQGQFSNRHTNQHTSQHEHNASTSQHTKTRLHCTDCTQQC